MSTTGTRDMRLDQFQLVDRIVDLGADRRTLKAAARVPGTHSIFTGHFPGHPLMPGVLIGELMAQTSGFLLLSRNGFSRMPFLASVKELNLRSFVAPGTELDCDARLVHEGSGYAVLDAEVRRTGEPRPVADARLTFRVTSFPNSALEDHLRDRAREVRLDPDSGRPRPDTGETR